MLCALLHILYYFFNYHTSYDLGNYVKLVFTNIPFLLSYIILSYSELDKLNYGFKKITLFPLFLFFPLIINYFIIPIYLQGDNILSNYGTLDAFFILLGILVILPAATLSFLNINNSDRNIVSIGLLANALVSCGIEVEYLSNGALKFSFYDTAWLGIIFIIAIPAIFFKDVSFKIEKNNFALMVHAKTILLSLLFFPIFLICIFVRADSISVISIIFSTIVSLILVYMFLEFFKIKLNRFTMNKFSSKKESFIPQIDELLEGLNKSLHEQKNVFRTQVIEYSNNIIDIITSINHDVKSPLTSIDMAASTLGVEYLKQKNIISKSSAKILEMVEDLNVKKEEYFLVPTNIIPLLEKIIEEKKFEYINEKSLTINFNRNLLEAVVKFPKNKLERIISNIINNAIESKDKKNIMIELNLASNDSGIELQIIDNGRGIKADDQFKIFQQGFTKGKLIGSGIGLYTAKKELNKYGADIILKKSSELGSIFIIQF